MNIDSSIQVLLHAIAKNDILALDPLVELGSPLEVLFWCSRIAVHLVLGSGSVVARRVEANDVKERASDIGGSARVMPGESGVTKELEVTRSDIVFVRGIVLQTALLWLHGVLVQVGDLGDGRVACLAVVALRLSSQ